MTSNVVSLLGLNKSNAPYFGELTGRFIWGIGSSLGVKIIFTKYATYLTIPWDKSQIRING